MYRVHFCSYGRDETYADRDSAIEACRKAAKEQAADRAEEKGCPPQDVDPYFADWRGGGVCPNGSDGAYWPSFCLACSECGRDAKEHEEKTWMVGDEAAFCPSCKKIALRNVKACAISRYLKLKEKNVLHQDRPFQEDFDDLEKFLNRMACEEEIAEVEATFDYMREREEENE